MEKHGHDLSAVIWIQGESDHNHNIDYVSYFNQMKSQILKGLKSKDDVKFIVTQTSRCGSQPGVINSLKDRDRKLNAQQLQLGNDKITRKMNNEIGLPLWCLEEKLG